MPDAIGRTRVGEANPADGGTTKPTVKDKRGRIVTPEEWTVYFHARREGLSINRAAIKAGISRPTIHRVLAAPDRSPAFMRAKRVFDEMFPLEPQDMDRLNPEARRALEDFAYFRLRYFGRYSTPWQTHAAEQIVALLASPDKEYAVINVPPGAGKSTLFTHDIPCWLIVRNRAVRIMIGSATERVAKSYGARIRRSLERPEKLKNDSDKVQAGVMADAQATLIEDFGRFKPSNRDLWRADEFVVEQPGGTSDEKEATVATYGRDGGFLGGRFDFVIWDDLVTKKILSTAEAREGAEDWWDSEAETRLEPGGLMVLQGQRLRSDDLYRYCLNKKNADPEDDNEADAPAMYRHIVYKAHYPQHCRPELHRRGAPAYDPHKPQDSGCLLDPIRLPWTEMSRRMKNALEKFLVNYQQEDTDPATVLVQKLWVNGGRDPETGQEFPGCWDHDRSVAVIPPGLARPFHLVVTADPSPSKFWSVQAWLWHPATEQRFLIDHHRGAMTAPAFLDYDINTGTFVGLLESWWQHYNRQGCPFRHVVVEQNAAQRFLLQYDHVKKWMALRGVAIIGHDTYGNKSDPDFGVQTVAPHWQYARVRLPGNRSDVSRGRSMALVDEVTVYPDGRTDDCVMAEWFFEHTLQKFLKNQLNTPATPPRIAVPSWMRRTG